MYDYSKLKGRIIEVCGTQVEFAKLMGLSVRTISHKMKQNRWWKTNEINKALEILNLTIDDVQTYFFTTKVQL